MIAFDEWLLGITVVTGSISVVTIDPNKLLYFYEVQNE